jgi:hypothetical protein
LLRWELFDGVVVGWWMRAGPLVGGGVGAVVEADVGCCFCGVLEAIEGGKGGHTEIWTAFPWTCGIEVVWICAAVEVCDVMFWVPARRVTCSC